MRANRIRTLQVLSCLACAALALRPVPRVERILDGALVTTRALAGLAAPFSGLGRVRASGEEADLRALAERDQRDALEHAVRRSAEPSQDLSLNVVPVHAEVIGRPRGALDVLEVRVDRVGLVRVGQPVVTGDVYVGTVSSVRLGTHSGARVEHVEVSLVTGRGARIGARVVGEDGQDLARAVVGGLLEPVEFGLPDAGQVLCVHFPSLRSLQSGRAVVAEPEGVAAGTSDHNYLANGFELGNLVVAEAPDERTRQRLLGVQAGVDYAGGLYQVLILTRPRRGDAPLAERKPRWASARLALRADPSLGRAGRKLLRGSWGDVLPGAAVATGVRLYGRVSRTGPWTSDVRTLHDPGFGVPAIAVLSESGGPSLEVHVLGRLVSLGQADDGRLRMAWRASLPLDGDEPRPARLWTGSGEQGMDRGLLIGDSWLPPGPGPHELLVDLPQGPAEPAELRVRLRDLERVAKKRGGTQ